MKSLSNNMRILIKWIIGFIFIALTINVYNWYEHKSLLKYYQNSTNTIKFMDFIEKNPDDSILTRQEVYDLFYYKYDKFFDKNFSIGYHNAYSNCLLKRNECTIREEGEKRLKENNKLCFLNNVQYCIKDALFVNNSIIDFNKKIELFEKSVIKERYCENEDYQKFFKNLSEEEKSKLDKKVLEICRRKY